MSLGNTISQKRKTLKLSQEYVAEQLGVSRQAVSKWETDGSKPSTDHLISLAEMFDCDVKELTSPEEYKNEQKKPENQRKESQKNIRMQIAAAFGRVLMLVGFVGYMDVDMSEFGSLPEWYPYTWWGVLFLIGTVLTFLGSWDYFNRKSGSRKIIWFDLLFVFAFFLHSSILPFAKNINTFITLIYGIIVLSMMNIKFWIPLWRK